MIPTLYPILGGRRSEMSIGSLIFNGSNEVLTSNQSGTPTDRTRLTFSFWSKIALISNNAFFLLGGLLDSTLGVYSEAGFNDLNLINEASGSENAFEFTAEDVIPVDNSWNHFTVRWDTTQGTSDNRIRLYKNGSLLGDSAGVTPGNSTQSNFFIDGGGIFVGNGSVSFNAKRMAFIQVIDGISLDPTSFAFDNGGTWTHKPYTGSYGTFGFRIDGSAGFNDASSNGRSFTGNNMTIADNIDTTDLPPYTLT
jgi:hypothetical protein